jgi:hypothetical protein
MTEAQVKYVAESLHEFNRTFGTKTQLVTELAQKI